MDSSAYIQRRTPEHHVLFLTRFFLAFLLRLGSLDETSVVHVMTTEIEGK